MKNVIRSLVLSAAAFMCLAAVGGSANAGNYFVKGLLGPTWYQSDSNSNHYAILTELQEKAGLSANGAATYYQNVTLGRWG